VAALFNSISQKLPFIASSYGEDLVLLEPNQRLLPLMANHLEVST
jgi:hypothetical protein